MVKFLASLIISGVALIPTWLFLFIRHLANPEGFWQNLVMFGIGFWTLGFIQLVCLILGIGLILGIYTEVS